MQTKTANGYIQSSTPNDIYYTFDVNDTTWQGVENKLNVLHRQINLLPNQILPGTKCIVKYNAHDPGNNSLKEIIPSNVKSNQTDIAGGRSDLVSHDIESDSLYKALEATQNELQDLQI